MPRKIQAFVKPERVLTSYDFIDIARGSSIVEFYGGMVSGGASASEASSYACSNVKWWSDWVYTNWTEGAGIRFSRDFDIGFKFPKIVEGDIIINVPLGIDNNGNTRNIWANVKAYRVDVNSAEHLIGSGLTGKKSLGVAVGLHYWIAGTSINDVKQLFKPGEILRFRIDIYHPAGAGAGTNCRLGHDPKNRSFDCHGDTVIQDAPSQLTFQVPFKIFV